MSVGSYLTISSYLSTNTLTLEKENIEKKRKLSGLLKKKKGRDR